MQRISKEIIKIKTSHSGFVYCRYFYHPSYPPQAERWASARSGWRGFSAITRVAFAEASASNRKGRWQTGIEASHTSVWRVRGCPNNPAGI